MNPSEKQLQILTEQVCRIAQKAAQYITDQCLDVNTVQQKQPHDYVTHVDRTSEEFIVDKLHQLLPAASFLCEEGTQITENNKSDASLQHEHELTWIIDPLDGTTNFIHNHAPHCVSIALKDPQEILVGVVCECTRNEVFYAYRNGPSSLNNHTIHVSSVDNLDQAFILLGTPYDAQKYKSFLMKLIQSLYGNSAAIRINGAAAAELCYVASGRAEARIEPNLKAWDIAAAKLILQQAGGLMTDFQGIEHPLFPQQVLATNKLVHNRLLKIINSSTSLFS